MIIGSDRMESLLKRNCSDCQRENVKIFTNELEHVTEFSHRSTESDVAHVLELDQPTVDKANRVVL